jgi:hypothetical protein
VFFLVPFWEAGLYAEAGLEADAGLQSVSTGIGAWGWWALLHGGKGGPLRITSTPRGQAIGVAPGTVGGTGAEVEHIATRRAEAEETPPGVAPGCSSATPTPSPPRPGTRTTPACGGGCRGPEPAGYIRYIQSIHPADPSH